MNPEPSGASSNKRPKPTKERAPSIPESKFYPSHMPILLPEDDDALFAQCDFEAFRASGKGGQHINKTDSAVRLHHRPTGITVTSQESRSQWQNRYFCLQKIREKVAKLNVVAKPRKATKKTWSSKQNNLVEKRQHSEKKKIRSSRDWD